MYFHFPPVAAVFIAWILQAAVVSGENLVDSSTLRFVHVLWRHGDRSPSKATFPKDKNGVWMWPQGWGELSKEGMKQQYALGAYMRQRYVDSGFMSKNYNASEIYIRSTSYNRTIMSALSNLAGMYPPSSSEKWSENINWQPIPVHAIPKELDPMLWMDLPCPVALDIYHKEILHSEAVRRIEKEYASFFVELRQLTGSPVPGLDDVWSIFDPLNCERIHKVEWPSGFTDAIFDKITLLSDLSSSFYYHDFRIQRLRGGLLFGEIANRMDAKAHNSSSIMPVELKYYVYSAHDVTMMGLLENLGAYSGRVPQYATAVIFELHEETHGNFIVKVFHINETGSQSPVPLAVKDCGGTDANPQCDLDKFVTLARSHTPSDWYAECGVVSSDSVRARRMTIATIVLGILTGLLGVIAVILLRKLQRGSQLK